MQQMTGGRTSEELVTKIDDLIGQARKVKGSWRGSDYDGDYQDRVGYERLVTESFALLEAVYDTESIIFQRFISATRDRYLSQIEMMVGILEGTRAAILSGMIRSIESRVAREVETELLDLASRFLDEGQKDPAAVLACAVLEDSVKRVAQRNGIDTEDKELSDLKNALKSKGIVEKASAGPIESGIFLRNKAFHADWDKVTPEAVAGLLGFLRLFILKHEL